MRAKTTITALALALTASAAVAGPASAKTSATISIQTQTSGVFGFVKSSKSSCHSGRKVTVYRKVSGPDKKAGSDIAQPNQDGSQYSVGLSRAGKYYAKVPATSKCKGATSKTKTFSPSESEDAAASHSMTKEEAVMTAERIAERGIERGEGKYVKSRVRCTVLFPHRVRCSIGYFTKNSLAENKARCIEQWMMLFYPHKQKGNSRRVYTTFANDDNARICR